ncbi:thiamine diphosphokinase, partial [Candidatus Gottesmanbacteria bacterium]|nr:thiamine diphosphokinase [Candidatus Gottesmanbacteria bacterium]
MNTVAIVGAGKLLKQFLPEIIKRDYVIGVDRGAYWLIANNIIPDIAIGDFDSVNPRELRVIKQKVKRTEEYPREKDATDMELAVEHTIS